jgi:hypothetical protein
MDGYIAIALVGVILFVIGVVMNKAKNSTQKKTKDERMADYFKSYNERIDKFRKQ